MDLWHGPQFLVHRWKKMATYPTSIEETHLISYLNFYLDFVISERRPYIHNINHNALWGDHRHHFSRYNGVFLAFSMCDMETCLLCCYWSPSSLRSCLLIRVDTERQRVAYNTKNVSAPLSAEGICDFSALENSARKEIAVTSFPQNTWRNPSKHRCNANWNLPW